MNNIDKMERKKNLAERLYKLVHGNAIYKDYIYEDSERSQAAIDKAMPIIRDMMIFLGYRIRYREPEYTAMNTIARLVSNDLFANYEDSVVPVVEAFVDIFEASYVNVENTLIKRIPVSDDVPAVEEWTLDHKLDTIISQESMKIGKVETIDDALVKYEDNGCHQQMTVYMYENRVIPYYFFDRHAFLDNHLVDLKKTVVDRILDSVFRSRFFPREIWEKIYRHNDLHDMLKMRLVCKSFLGFIDQPETLLGPLVYEVLFRWLIERNNVEENTYIELANEEDIPDDEYFPNIDKIRFQRTQYVLQRKHVLLIGKDVPHDNHVGLLICEFHQNFLCELCEDPGTEDQNVLYIVKRKYGFTVLRPIVARAIIVFFAIYGDDLFREIFRPSSVHLSEDLICYYLAEIVKRRRGNFDNRYLRVLYYYRRKVFYDFQVGKSVLATHTSQKLPKFADYNNKNDQVFRRRRLVRPLANLKKKRKNTGSIFFDYRERKLVKIECFVDDMTLCTRQHYIEDAKYKSQFDNIFL